MVGCVVGEVTGATRRFSDAFMALAVRVDFDPPPLSLRLHAVVNSSSALWCLDSAMLWRDGERLCRTAVSRTGVDGVTTASWLKGIIPRMAHSHS